jgi:hypothetical protein
MNHVISRLGREWIGVILLVTLIGCITTSPQECTYFSSKVNEQIGIVLCEDSISISTPYFTTVLATENKGRGVIKIEHDTYHGTLEIGSDSAVLNLDGEQFICYPLNTQEYRWDSILIMKRALQDSATIVSFIQLKSNGNVLIKGDWGERYHSCKESTKLRGSDALVDNLIKEFGIISKDDFHFIPTLDSDGITYISLKKCRDGECETFTGDYLPFGYFTIQLFLGNPFDFVTCM